MNCVNCGAPLPATSNICTFCNTLNDTDLRAIEIRSQGTESADRVCPHCEINLVHMNIGGSKALFIDRCPTCLGIFFDNGELETVLKDKVDSVHHVDYQRIEALAESERPMNPATEVVRYVKCPVCRRIMNRNAYGTRSGVIVDTCREDGVWLDAGELGQLLKWAKAGGETLHARREEERKREAEREERVKSNLRGTQHIGGRFYHTSGGDIGHLDEPLLTGVIRLIAGLLH